MFKKKFPLILLSSFFLFSSAIAANASSAASAATPASATSTEEANPVVKLLQSIEYSSRFKVEYSDNIFSTPDNQDSDWREIFTQTLLFKLPGERQYFQLGYSGNYGFYNEESTGVLGHSANLLYSYRPFDGFSIGLRDDYNWLQDSKITTTLGDRVLALGYIQNVPSVEMKYEINPDTMVAVSTYYQFLDVVDSNNDDFIDNKRVGAKTQLNYNFTPLRNLAGFVGYDYRQVSYNQTPEKAFSGMRPFVGLSEKVIGIMKLSEEVGFDNIDMVEQGNADDHNVDFKFLAESIFSIYTKLKLSFDYNVKNSSFRRQYTQYASDVAALNLTHAINPKTYILFDYSYEHQRFNADDILIGQTREDNDAFVQNLRLALSRKLNSWLNLDWRYDYTKRDTDFAQEGYTNNQFSAALTAKY